MKMTIPFYKGIIGKRPFHENDYSILQRNYRIMTIVWSLSYNSFVKFHLMVIKLGSHNMAMLYPHSCYNKVCYKKTTVYIDGL